MFSYTGQRWSLHDLIGYIAVVGLSYKMFTQSLCPLCLIVPGDKVFINVTISDSLTDFFEFIETKVIAFESFVWV